MLTVDHFGNVQLAAPGSTLDRFGSVVRIGDLRVIRGATFGDAPPGELVAYRDSAGRLALAVNGGRAADVLGVAAGDLLRLERPAGTGGSAT